MTLLQKKLEEIKKGYFDFKIRSYIKNYDDLGRCIYIKSCSGNEWWYEYEQDKNEYSRKLEFIEGKYILDGEEIRN